jgi:ribose 1,5-bisphosphokinase PhnN
MPAPPRPLIICGPSGVGKGTIISALTASDSSLLPAEAFGFSVSHTTRKPRQGEENGVHYHFVGREEMKGGIEAGEFVEFAEVHGNYYGTRLVLLHLVCGLLADHCYLNFYREMLAPVGTFLSEPKAFMFALNVL